MKRIDFAIAAYCVLLLIFGFNDAPVKRPPEKSVSNRSSLIHRSNIARAEPRRATGVALPAQVVRTPFR
ncbi:MAG: hypothetical protein HY961_14910 [Ignavibacteriae bacterium]|nr:hypothetical protein [Ignavibacteriota bacterium]